MKKVSRYLILLQMTATASRYTETTIVLERATATYFNFQIKSLSIYCFLGWHSTFDGLAPRLGALKTGRNLKTILDRT